MTWIALGALAGAVCAGLIAVWVVAGPGQPGAMDLRPWAAHGLALHVPARGWDERAPALAGPRGALDFDGPDATRVGFFARDARAGEPPSIDIVIRHAPSVPSLAAILALERRARHGPTVRADAPEAVVFVPHPGHAWLRTRFQYQRAVLGQDRPVHAVEYAIVQADRLFRVTFSGHPGDPPERVLALADAIAPSLRLESAAPSRPVLDPLEPMPPPPAAVTDSARAVVMVLAADVRDDVVHIRAQGSGAVVSADGWVLGSLHVLYDESARELHDLFFIGLSRGWHRSPEFVCLGRPTRSVLDEAGDLALMRCERGLAGPLPDVGAWPSLAVDPGAEARDGDAAGTSQRVYLVGFPESSSGRLAWTMGALDEPDAGPDAPYLRTSATVTAGMSGGAALSARGRLIGVASAYRYRVQVPNAEPSSTQVERIGLVRPVSRARLLLDRSGGRTFTVK